MGGSFEVVKENLYRIAKENATRSGGSSIQKGYDMKTTGKQEEKGGMVPLNQRSISYESLNIRGAGRPNFVSQVKKLTRKFAHDICFNLKQKSMQVDLWIFFLNLNLSVLTL